ncbi:MAG: hypothetical protein K8S56_10645, partial [Candidatus Cloacimonetes bacterium]|nr:hypothetical protein [Candidatus Cloacimonadota bacterium]
SRALSEELDIADIFAGAYYLEVSSMGLERKLKYKKHFVSAINDHVKITVKDDGKTVVHKGSLIEVMPEHIRLQTEDEAVLISFQDIRKAQTVFDFRKDL